MQRLQAYQFKLLLNREQQFGMCRFVFNKEVLGMGKNATATAVIGIGMCTARFATFSDRGYLEPLNHFKKYQLCLTRHPQYMRRKFKFSKNWQVYSRALAATAGRATTPTSMTG